ncbi:MAG: O-antigen ligase family protein [Sedimentisphaerales bacterium]|nr:O-antigen ligase family protein [Sedimentisphaerales bacterium]
MSFALCFLQARKYILYWLVLFAVMANIIWGYMDVTGLLSLSGGKAYSVLDFQFALLLLVGYPLSRKDVLGRPSSGMDRAIFIISLLIVLNVIVGSIRVGIRGGVLSITQVFMLVPLYFVAANILSNPENVKQFYRWVVWFALFVFFVHIAVAFKIYYPPLSVAEIGEAERAQAAARQVAFLRSSHYLYEPFYIVAACVAACRIMYGRGRKLVSWICLICCGFGTLLTQARGLYGGFALAVLGVFVLAKGKGKIKAMAVIMAALIVLLSVLAMVQRKGVDIFWRFTRVGIVGERYSETVRGREFSNLIGAIKRTPASFLTGQGFGVTFQGIGDSKPRGYYHNDYFGTMFSLGLIGFICYCYIIYSSIFRGRKYCHDPDLALLIMPCRLIFFALAGYAVFNQTFWLYKGCGLLIVFAAISRNSDYFASLIYNNEESLPDDYLVCEDTDIIDFRY